MRAGLTPNAVQWCRCGGLRGPNLAECVAVRRRFRAKVGGFWQSLGILFAGYEQKISGEIEVVDIPTTLTPVPRTNIPVNVGKVIRSEKVLEMEDIL